MRSLDLWAGILASSFLGGALAVCDSGDTIGCLPLKTVQCASNVLDISFMLDRSGSMFYGMNGKNEDSGELCKEEFPAVYQRQGDSCKRQNIMRITLRRVMKEIFLKFQRGCLEYLQTERSRAEGDCEARGFTTTRFNIVWWSTGDGNSKQDEYLNQQFSADGSNKGISGSFKNYFYESDGSRRAGRWVNTNGIYTMDDDAIDNYFKKVLLKGNTNTKKSGDVFNRFDPWPMGSGGTQPYGGMNRMSSVLSDAYAIYSPAQKANARFPVFLMTDGEYNGKNMLNLMKNSHKKLKSLTNKEEQMSFYGLGLTGKTASVLRKIQADLYKELGYDDSINILTANGVENIQLYFNDEKTAERVVSALFKEVQAGCEDCYELDGVTKCVSLGADAPTFSSTNTTFDRVEPDNQPPPGSLNSILNFDTQTNFEEFFGIGNDVFKIPAETRLCQNFFGNGNGDNLYPGYLFVQYDKDGNCMCCAEGSQPCLCDYKSETVIGTRTVKIASGADAYDIEIPLYEESSYLSSELGEKFDNVTSTLADQSGGGDGGQDSGEGEGPTINGTDPFKPVRDRDDSDDGNDSSDSGGGPTVKDPDPINGGDATRIASLISLMAIPMAMMAAMM